MIGYCHCWTRVKDFQSCFRWQASPWEAQPTSRLAEEAGTSRKIAASDQVMKGSGLFCWSCPPYACIHFLSVTVKMHHLSQCQMAVMIMFYFSDISWGTPFATFALADSEASHTQCYHSNSALHVFSVGLCKRLHDVQAWSGLNNLYSAGGDEQSGSVHT